MEDLVQRLSRSNKIKCKCGSKDIARKRGERTGLCRNCRCTVNLTANTFLHGIRNPKAWHLNLWLRERGVSLSSKRFAELAGISQSTAWCMNKKIAAVIVTHMTEECYSLYSGFFLGLIYKRSKETPRREHPRAEQLEFDEMYENEFGTPPPDLDEEDAQHAEEGSYNQPHYQVEVENVEAGESSDDATSALSEAEQRVYSFISNQPVQFEQLLRMLDLEVGELSSLLTTLELAGLVESSIGDWYVRIEPRQATRRILPERQDQVTDSQKAGVQHAKDFLSKVFLGISRKYVQSYLAEFWFFVDRNYWQQNSIWEACLSHSDIELQTIKNSVSPAMVKVMRQQMAA